VVEISDFAANEEIVDGKAYPTESQNEDRSKNLTQKATFGCFENVYYTPYGAYNT
jgi:hypothetical protein